MRTAGDALLGRRGRADSGITASFGRGNTVRIGGVATHALTDHLDIAGLLLIPIQSPDDLGFKGTFGSIRLRRQWATGEPHPGFGSF
jgi:hypothetical protein